MISVLDKIIRIIYNVLLAILVAMAVTMLGIALAHVFYRYVLNDSLTWSEEFLKVLLVWFCILSATIIGIRREHVSIVIFKNMFPIKVQKVLSIVTQFIMLSACVVALVLGIRLVLSAGTRMLPSIRIPYGLAYGAIPVAFAIMTLYELRNFLADILHGRRCGVDMDAEGFLPSVPNGTDAQPEA